MFILFALQAAQTLMKYHISAGMLHFTRVYTFYLLEDFLNVLSRQHVCPENIVCFYICCI